MLQGVAYQTSKFDKNLETDFEGAGATLLFDTQRLKQFTEEFNILEQLEDEDQRILLKQWLFFKYEKELKRQTRDEKAQKLQQNQDQNLNESQNQSNLKSKNVGEKRKGQRRTISNGSNFNVSNKSMKTSSILMRNGHDVKLSQLIDISVLQLDTSLSDLGTLDRKIAQKQEKLLEAQLSQLLAVSNDIPGLKSCTQKELIDLVENNWKQMQFAKKDDRKVLGWSSNEDDESCIAKPKNKMKNSDNFEGIISQSDIQVQVANYPQICSQVSSIKNTPQAFLQYENQMKIENELEQESQSNCQFPSNLSSLRSHGPQRGDFSQLTQEDQSFNNESMTYDELEQLTPNNPQRKGQIHQTPLRIEAAQLQINEAIEIRNKLLNPNATSTSDESSFLMQQKKSLEVITEKSEFSNTTYARPGSYRSKQSKQMSSQKNGSSIIQPNTVPSREINGSIASLNNSSMIINSSRNQVGKNLQPVKSFADILEIQNEDEIKNIGDKAKRKRRISGVGQVVQALPLNQKIAFQSQVFSQASNKFEIDADKLFHRDHQEFEQFEIPKFPQSTDTEAMQLNILSSDSKAKHSANLKYANHSPEQNVKKARQEKSILNELKQQNQHKQKAQPQKEKVGGVFIIQNTHDDQKNSSRSYLEKSYLDESDHASIEQFNLEQRLSSVKKQNRRQQLIYGVERRRDLIDFQHIESQISPSDASDVSPFKGIYRSNSEQYLKNLDMQDESDNLFIEINPIIYAPETSPSMPQSTQLATRFRIDSSQLNNLTRHMLLHGSTNRQNITRGQPGSVLDSNTSVQIHTTLYNCLQRLFIQAQQNAITTNGVKNQSMTGQRGNSLTKILSSTNMHKTASDPQFNKIGLTVLGPTINKQSTGKNGFTVTSGTHVHIFNESAQLHHPEVYIKTLLALQNLQGQTSHKLNRAVGLLFSNTEASKNLIMTSPIADRSQALQTPQNPYFSNQQQVSVSTYESNPTEEQRNLRAEKISLNKYSSGIKVKQQNTNIKKVEINQPQQDKEAMQNFLQSKIAYQSEQRGVTTNQINRSVLDVKHQEKSDYVSSRSVDRIVDQDPDQTAQSMLQKKYRLKSSQQQAQKIILSKQDNIKVNQNKQIFFQRDNSQSDSKDQVQSQLTITGKGPILKRINIAKLPIKRGQLTNGQVTLNKDARVQQIQIQRANGVASACSNQHNNNSSISYNGVENSVDLSKIMFKPFQMKGQNKNQKLQECLSQSLFEKRK